MSKNKKKVISVLLASAIGISTAGLLKDGIEFVFVTNMYNFNLGINEEVYLVHMGDKQGLNNFEHVVYKSTYSKLLENSKEFNDEKILNLKK